MPESSLPPSPPTTNNNGLLIGGALVALLAAGGLFLALKGSDGQDQAAPAPPPTATPTSVRAAPPPPPPPPPAEETSSAPSASAVVAVQPKPGGGGITVPAEGRGPSGCGGACTGSADSGLRDALRLRGASAKGCYNKALRSNPTLQGKMTIAVRVSPTGTACSASVASDSLRDASVSSCILQQFRAGSYPKPKGGCVDVQVPLNFIPGG